jgi:hypothetical protein
MRDVKKEFRNRAILAGLWNPCLFAFTSGALWIAGFNIFQHLPIFLAYFGAVSSLPTILLINLVKRTRQNVERWNSEEIREQKIDKLLETVP